MWTLYQQNQDLIKVGAYQSGANAELDEAISRRPDMERFLCQEMHEGVDLGASAALLAAFAGQQG